MSNNFSTTKKNSNAIKSNCFENDEQNEQKNEDTNNVNNNNQTNKPILITTDSDSEGSHTSNKTTTSTDTQWSGSLISHGEDARRKISRPKGPKTTNKSITYVAPSM